MHRTASFILLPLVVILLMIALARAEDYSHIPPHIRQWYDTRVLTPAAQERFGFTSCCRAADVVKTQFRVDRAGGTDQWWWLKDGAWSRVPDDIIHWNDSAPHGRPVLFAVGGAPVCFFPPNGGI